MMTVLQGCSCSVVALIISSHWQIDFIVKSQSENISFLASVRVPDSLVNGTNVS